MPQELTAALKAAKDIDRNLTVSENRLQFVTDEVKRLTATRDAMQAEIDQKAANYNIYIAQRDAETKKIRQDTLESTDQLAKDKKEFQDILKQFQNDKASVDHDKNANEAERGKIKAQKEAIQGFITAVQRACSLLGL